MPKEIRCRRCDTVTRVPDDRTGSFPCSKCKVQIPIVDGEDAAIPVVSGDETRPPKGVVPRPSLAHSVTDKQSAGPRWPAVEVPVVRPDEPRRRRAERASDERSSGGGSALIILAVVGLLLFMLCGIGGVGAIFWLGGRSSGTTFTTVKVASGGEFKPMAVDPAAPPPNVPRPQRARPDAFAPKAQGPAKLPPAPAVLPIAVAPLTADIQKIPLPEPVERVAPGGGGRFLVLLFRESRNFSVFDLNTLQRTNAIALPEAGAWIAAGMRRLVVYLPTAGKLRRYELLTGKLEREADFQEDGVTTFVMGCASDGPLLVRGGHDLNKEPTFIDIETLQPMAIPSRGSGFGSPVNLYWPSADGHTFGGCWNNLSPTVLSIADGFTTKFTMNAHTRFVVPFADGKHVCTGGRGVLTRDLKKVDSAALSITDSGIHLQHLFVPAQSGSNYMHVQVSASKQAAAGLNSTPGTIDFYTLGNKNSLLTLRDVALPKVNQVDSYSAISIPRGVHFSPASKALIVVPPSQDHLMLYRVDLEAKR